MYERLLLSYFKSLNIELDIIDIHPRKFQLAGGMSLVLIQVIEYV